jgi:conjugative relaxase-like TrwC/TraI family protein
MEEAVMLTISKPLSEAQVCRYHAEEFTNAQDNYYTVGDQIRGQWHGRLATAWGLAGDVHEDHIRHLAEGRHPITGDQLVRVQTVRTYENLYGDPVTTMGHRAGWDATFSAPKSVSLTALVGGDERVTEAHRASVRVALDAMEPYVQARIGRNHPAETTGRWVAAIFEHDSARPVDGYAAPQLHTHVVFFNMTERDTGETRAMQPRELYTSQPYLTAVYRSELATRLTGLGYEIERGASGQPEIHGYTPEYLEASSPRRQQIETYLTEVGQSSAEAAHIAAHQTRAAKIDESHADMQARHQALAVAYGDQPSHVVQAARDRHLDLAPDAPAISAQLAVSYATDRNLEREAVVDDRTLLRDALTRSMGELSVGAITTEFEDRVDAGEYVAVRQPPGAAARAFTTPEMIALERETIERMRAGQHTQPALASEAIQQKINRAYPQLNDPQRAAVQQILASRDQVQALDGIAGAGKTTTLAAIRDATERAGYAVEGFAPTSRAAQQLAEAGIPTSTLQHHLARQATEDRDFPRLYVLDESSLASTRQVHAFLHRLEPEDRVLLVGDVRQHQAVEAGRPYQQLQEAGIAVARLDTVVRQRDPALKHVVEQLARGHVDEAVHDLERQGRVHEVVDREDRLRIIARAYANQPDGTLIVSPDNESRRALNQIIHSVLQVHGNVEHHEHRVRVLVPRQDVTGADRQWAARYAPGDVLRYTTGSRVLGIAAGEYARVDQVDVTENAVTVRRSNGESVPYDPRRLQGVMLFREAERAFAVGDRVQLTAPDREHRLANRELGTIERIEVYGDLQLRLDTGRRVAFRLEHHPHLDYGYVVTSHSSQGQTADRVLVHIDTEARGERLINRRFAYVALSRGRYDAQIYTNDKAHLAEALGRDISHRTALDIGHAVESPGQRPESSVSHRRGAALGLG